MSTHAVISPASMPHQVVHASAGTGKTYYLTNRLLRLLLLGVKPGAIVAITFTNKAAAEIESRVFARAAALLMADDVALEKLFAELQIEGGAARRHHARRLYESLIAATPPVRVTTFHAFCLDLLRRLPQEAGLAPGFDLTEDPARWARGAWEALGREAASDADTRAALEELLAACDSGHNVDKALDEFLHHRADWWAYTEDAAEPVAYASERLAAELGRAARPDALSAPEQPLAEPAFVQAAARYAALMARHDTATLQSLAAAITHALTLPPTDAFASLWDAFFTQKGAARVVSKKLLSILSTAEADECLHCRAECMRVLEAVLRARRRQHTLRLSRAWYRAGSRLLAHFQALKAADNVVDFADLEWRAYRLLTAADHAEWVQYKLDQRIDHVLIDEFQDTNPTQWRLLLPLLTEMTAGDSERARSILLVGDEKQAIYRFRRAEPALFAAASQWLETQGRAERLTQAASWRSSPAIVDFVNLIFAAPGAASLLPDFAPHTTHRRELWGRVEVLPPIALEASRDAPLAAAGGELRNPLLAPRAIPCDRRYEREAAQLVTAIRDLVGRITIGADARPLRYGDILLLLRERKHADSYEQALRAAGMPYIGTATAYLNEQPEIRDIVQLLTCLHAPGDAFALATVLRSPVFAATDDDLIALRLRAGTIEPADWERALAHADAPPLKHAHRLLGEWRARVDTVPVHDLLDTIYDTGNVLARFEAATPVRLRTRVRANLERLLALALEIDSGRYPTVARFLQRLAELGLPAETPTQNEDAIRILTVHGAKGLEAPVVFLLDADRPPKPEKGLRPLIVWPADAPRPSHFHLIGRADEVDDLSARLCTLQAEARAQEENNLLYVALTRARQMLFISGCESRRGAFWHQALCARLRAAPADTPGFARNAEGNGFSLRYGDVPAPAEGCPDIALNTAPDIAVGVTPAGPTIALDPALTLPVQTAAVESAPLAPSALRPDAHADPNPRRDAPAALALDDTGRDLARRRGRALHALLDAHTRMPPAALDTHIVATQFGLAADEVVRLSAEVRRLIAQPALRAWFDPARYERAENEMPVLFRAHGRDVHGVIDRAIFTGAEIAIVDYKGHAGADDNDTIARYAPQLRLYAHGVRLLWPNYRVRAFILFTADAHAVEVPLAEVAQQAG